MIVGFVYLLTIGKTISEAGFRAVDRVAVIAVHRAGKWVEQMLGDIELMSGDTLPMQTGSHFAKAHRHNPNFYLVGAVEDWRPSAGTARRYRW